MENNYKCGRSLCGTSDMLSMSWKFCDCCLKILTPVWNLERLAVDLEAVLTVALLHMSVHSNLNMRLCTFH